jgi:MarR family transcriptional regulator, lower aerobic nicotinate degradation pathway regulator
MDSLRRLVRALRHASVASERELGISLPQIFALQLLKQHKTLSINELAELTLTHQSTVSELVDKLVVRGLCDKQPCPDDRRRMAVTLTPAGSRIAQRSFVTPQERLCAALLRMSPVEVGRLASCLRRWAELAGIDDQPAALFFESDAENTRQKGNA